MPIIGTAGWSIPKQHAGSFGAEGSHLQRYAARLPGVEINSSFYKPHRPATYARWAASVPDGFRFAAKVPKAITHQAKLRGPDVAPLLDAFLSEVTQLGEALGPLLVQLPASHQFDAAVVDAFLGLFRERFDGLLALEPRHASWFDGAADALLAGHRVARVAADPACVPAAAAPGGWDGLVYLRWHGSPRIYYSPYADARLDALADALGAAAARGAAAWGILDNTALGYAWGEALHVWHRLQGAGVA